MNDHRRIWHETARRTARAGSEEAGLGGARAGPKKKPYSTPKITVEGWVGAALGRERPRKTTRSE